eukprot:6180653-Pleurochrysis_carterae.AAC.3
MPCTWAQPCTQSQALSAPLCALSRCPSGRVTLDKGLLARLWVSRGSRSKGATHFSRRGTERKFGASVTQQPRCTCVACASLDPAENALAHGLTARHRERLRAKAMAYWRLWHRSQRQADRRAHLK